MKKIFVILLLIPLFSFTQEQPDQSDNWILYQLTKEVRFYEKPGSKLIAKIPEGDTIMIEGFKNDYFHVYYKQTEGYISNFYFNDQEEKLIVSQLQRGGQITGSFSISRDDFTDVVTTSLENPLLLSQEGFKMLTVVLGKVENKYVLGFLFRDGSSGTICTNGESEILLKLSDNKIITLRNIDKVDCGNIGNSNCYISENDLGSLSNTIVEKVRCYHTEGNIDYEVLNEIPNNYINRQYYKNYIGLNPKLVLQDLIEELISIEDME